MSGLRIGTFNTHLDSVIFKIGKDVLKFVEQWAASGIDPSANPFYVHASNMRNKAQQIANHICFGEYDYDVIVLNEVFDEDARHVLLNDAMKAKYPFRLEKLPEVVLPLAYPMLDVIGKFLGDMVGPVLDTLGVALPDLGEDSGLMLFSRFPIRDWRFTPFTFPDLEVMMDAAPDSLAAKGVGYARIFNPIMDETFNVVLTHMQENKEKWEDVRKNQLNQIEAFIRSLLTVAGIHEEDIFVLGDLNIIGNWRVRGETPKNIDNLAREAVNKEWDRHFNSPLGFFTSNVHDTWFYETSTKDEGRTTDGGIGSRIDYILHNPELSPRTNLNPLRVQHLTKAYNMFNGGGSLSDHIGLNADLNWDAPYCSPRTSDPIGLTPGNGAHILTAADGESIKGKITYPGSMVWYRLDDPGTYSVAVRSGDVEFEIYQSTDLSMPLGQYKDETTEHTDELERKFTAKKYVMVDPPFYIRVYNPDRTETGVYTLFVHKHTGLSWQDAIGLCPHVPYPPATGPPLFRKDWPINPDDTVWFEFDPLVADSGLPQNIVCEVSEYSEGVFKMTLLKEDHKTKILGGETGPNPSKLTLPLNDASPEGRDLCVGGSKIYLLVSRDDPTFTTERVAVKWTTNLTVFHSRLVDGRPVPSAIPLTLICDNETDPEWGVDEIIMKVWVDGIRVLEVFAGEFEKGSEISVENLIPSSGYRYLDNVLVQLFEQDHVSADDPSKGMRFLPLDGHREIGHREMPYDKSDKLEFEGGEYFLNYNRSTFLTSK